MFEILKRNAVCLILVTGFLAGCATTPPPGPVIHPFLLAHRLTIGSINYLPSSAVCRQLQGQGQWDPQSQIWTLTVGTHELRVTPQMPVALIDRLPYPLLSPPILDKGEILLPESIWDRWIATWEVPAPPPVPSAPLHLKTIILDAGHGGHDPGAIGRSGLREKLVTLDVTQRLRDLLAQDGFRVVMTRDRDRFISLSRRSEIANRAEADLFISIHANASRRRSISGFEVYVLSEATDDHARALEAAENASLPEEVGEGISTETEAIVWDLLYTEHRTESNELAASVCRGLARAKVPSQNRGVKSARFAVLKGTRMPAVLIEVGFVTHAGEEARLRSADYRQRLAEGIRDGILAFRESYERQRI